MNAPAKKPGFNWHLLLYSLLIFIPITFILSWTHASHTWIFVCACTAIIPLAGLMGQSTEHLAERVGPAIGGLLNASLGNAAELIIAIVALRSGQIHIVQASLTGSIIGNVLLVLGMAALFGGLKYPIQRFNPRLAGTGATMLLLSAMGMVLPASYHALYPATADAVRMVHMSTGIACIMFLTYLLGLLFQLVTHAKHFAPAGPGIEELADVETTQEHWSIGRSLFVLILATIGTALMSEMLVHSVEAASAQWGMSKIFIGVVVVAFIGNAAEHSTAVLMALKNKMDLAVNICLSSSIQIALFVAPMLVFAGLAFGQPMTLDFSPLEVISVILAVFAVNFVCSDGETNWLEGVQLLAVYAIVAWLFFELPLEPLTAPAAGHH